MVHYTNTSSPLDNESRSIFDTSSLAYHDGGNSGLDINSLKPEPDIRSPIIALLSSDKSNSKYVFRSFE